MKRTVLWSAIGIALALTAPPVQAEPARSADLPTLIDQAMRKSPGLQAKKRAYEAARGRVISAWLPDDPMFGVDVEGQPDFFNFSGRADNEYMVSQTIPFPTTLILRGQVALRDAQMAFQQYKEKERDVIWHLEQPYYEFYLAKKTGAALEEVRALLEKLAETARRRYEANQASLQDVLKAQIERSKVDIELYRTAQEEHLAQAHLSHILNLPLNTPYELPEERHSPPLSWTHEELEQLAVRMRPELRAAELGIKRAKTSRALALTRWLPDVTGRIEARQFRNGNPRERDTFIGVTVPVWSLLKGAGGEWKSAGKDVEEAEAAYQELKNEVLLSVHEAYAKAKTAEHALGVYEQFTLPQAKQQVELALSAYEAGRAGFLELIDAQRMLRDAQMAYYTFQAQHEMALSSLRLAIGGPLSDESRATGADERRTP
ncbi:MAG: hypothetical protein A3B78_03220 [Omnitrophica WOR_2 bacterium RIFCSPHIGHO2_02_FULL_67_20]|nr:MAG: hypothetical protein A3B78_03220 [Omnitrophica WOR_2 bacterium RIFCSPHIGHO2_02_FULL_67_20]